MTTMSTTVLQNGKKTTKITRQEQTIIGYRTLVSLCPNNLNHCLFLTPKMQNLDNRHSNKGNNKGLSK